MELQNAADKAKAAVAKAVNAETTTAVNATAAATAEAAEAAATAKTAEATTTTEAAETATESGQSPMMTDPASFDFEKWEKCMTQVLHEMPQ